MIPEEYGGSGLGLTEASIIMEEINRSGGNAGHCHGQMYNHFRVGPVDLGVVETGLDDGRLGIIRHEQMRNAADCREGMDMGVDPVGECLRPASHAQK